MAQPIPRERVLNVLQRRYDHQSAQVVFKRAVESVKLKDQEQYTREELQSIGEGLKKVGDRLDSLIGPLMALAGTASAPSHARESTRETPAAEVKRDDAARDRSRSETPRAADASSVVAVTPPTVTALPTPAAAQPASAADAPVSSSAGATDEATEAHSDDSAESAEGDHADVGGAGERDAKGRPRRKR